MSNRRIQKLLEKVSHYDGDERYMSISDLTKELASDKVVGEDSERAICAALLERLEVDKSNEVQTIAVRCLSTLMKRGNAGQVSDIVRTLCTQLLDGREELRDIYAIGMKTIVKDAPTALGGLVCEEATPLLYYGIEQNVDQRVKMECLDILTEILTKFGPSFKSISFCADREDANWEPAERDEDDEDDEDAEEEPEEEPPARDPAHELLLRVCLAQLKPIHSAPVYKRAGNCMSALVISLPDELLTTLMNSLLADIASHTGAMENARALVEALGGISRMVGHRLARGGLVPRVIQLLVHNLGDKDDEEMRTDAANELRENCLNALESLVKQCPREVADSLDGIVKTSLAFLTFDPNYAGAGDDESESDSDDSDDSDDPFGDDSNDDEDGEEEEGGDDGQLGQDYELILEGGNFDMEDDSSWKVRRAAAKVVSAITETRTDLPDLIYGRCAPALIARFGEREENVLVAVVHCVTEMLRVATVQQGASEDSSGSSSSSSSSVAALEALTPSIVNAMCAQLKSDVVEEMKTKKKKNSSSSAQDSTASSKAAEHMWEMSSALVELLSSSGASGAMLDAQLELIVPRLRAALHQRTADGQQRADGAPTVAALRFLRAILRTHRSTVIQPHLASLSALVANCVDGTWFELSAEALRVTCATVNAMKPAEGKGAAMPLATLDTVATMLGAAVTRCLANETVDQTVTEEAISCAGIFIAKLCDVASVGALASRLIELLVEVASFESCRTAALQAITLVASSPLSAAVGAHLAPHCAVLIPTLAGFLTQPRAKRETLAALNAIVHRFSAELDPESLQLVCAAASLVDESDLNYAGAALQLGTSLVLAAPEMAEAAAFVPAALQLANSSLLQGFALDALKEFLDARVRTQPEARAALLAQMLRPLKSSVQSLVVSNLAQCFAVVVLAGDGGPAAGAAKIPELVALLRTGTRSIPSSCVLLHCVGEIGCRIDVSTSSIHEIVRSLWESAGTDESVKRAAAFALGNAVVGAPTALLPVLQRELVNGEHAYFALSALKELISHHDDAGAVTTLSCGRYSDAVMPVLLTYCQSESDGVRSMVSECLGRMAAVQPESMLCEMVERADAAEKNTRAAIIAALKFCITAPQQSSSLDAVFAPLVPDIARRLEDEELDVVHATLLTLNVIAHHKPALLRAHFSCVGGPWAMIYDHMHVKKELKRSVDLGPFKKKVDDGLVIRKAAFTCVHTMLTSMRNCVDVSGFMDLLCSGLHDVQDIRTQCHAIVGTLCAVFPMRTLESSDAILKLLTKTAKVKMKEGVGTEEQRRYNLISSAVRAINLIGALPTATASRVLQDALAAVEGRPETKAMLASIQAERGDKA